MADNPGPPGMEPPEGAISARCTLGRRDISSALKAHSRGAMTRETRLVKVAQRFIAAVVTIGLLNFAFVNSRRTVPSSPRDQALVLTIVAGIWLFVLGQPLLFRAITWLSTRKPESKRTFAWEIGPEHLILSRPSLEAKTTWSHWTKVVESEDGFLLYETPEMYCILPASAFADASTMRRFAVLARDRVADYRVLETCRFPDELKSAGSGAR